MTSKCPQGTALGVVEVETTACKWPPLLLLLLPSSINFSSGHDQGRIGNTSSSSSSSSSSSERLWIARRWGLAFEASADRTGAIEVVWSKAPGVRAGDVLLAVGGKPVTGQPLGAVEKLLLASEGGGGKDGDSSNNNTMNPANLRLTLDTTKGWGVSSHARRQQQLEGGWARLGYRWLLDGYERLLDARCCPHRKLALHALALLLLFPVIESSFQSTNTLSEQHGPLVLLQHAHLLVFEQIWSVAFFLSTLGLGLAYASVRRPRLGAILVESSAVNLHCLHVALLLIPAVAGLTLLTSGFVLLPGPFEGKEQGGDGAVGAAEAEASFDLENELRSLLTHVLCALIVPLLAFSYLRRLAAFCDAYAALLGSGRNPKLLGLRMPLSAHFVAPGGPERERFIALRSCGF